VSGPSTPAATEGASAEPAHAARPSTASPRPSLLSVENLAVRFGGLQAVAGASFDVAPGSITGLIGPNGAGKSTVINAIGGQNRTATGRITFDGHDILGLRPERIARLGLRRGFQVANLFGGLTVMENMLIGARPWEGESLRASIIGRRKWRKVEAELTYKALGLMDDFGVRVLADELASNLSGGQKRIVEIMRTLMSDPIMMLLDEPMAGINPTLGRVIGEHLLRLREAGMTMLMIEHDLGLVEELCDPVVVMVQGAVLSEGSLRELRHNEAVVNAYLAG
jgi:neutral amino acid transport system ATP-binding protein